MDFKKVKGINHYLYDSIKEFRVHHPNEALKESWRNAVEGDWVVTDDDNVCQVLKCYPLKVNMSKKITRCVRTVLGTFRVDNHNIKMLGEDGIAENIYTFSGTNVSQKDFNKRDRNSRELLFAKYVASGLGAIEAYKRAYPDARSSNYIKNRTDKLLKTETIRTMIDKQI